MRVYTDLRVAMRNLQTFNIGGGNWDLDFIIRGPELEALAQYTNALRQQAPDLGIRTEDIAAALRLMMGGDQEVSRFRDPLAGEDYDVELRLAEADRRDPETIARLYVARNTAKMVRRDSVVRHEEGRTPSRVDRYDRQRQANLRSGIQQGYGLADRLEAVRAAAAQLGMPAGYTTAISGRGKECERTMIESAGRFFCGVHVHGSCRPVRSRFPDPRHAQPVLGAGHARALRRGRQERDPANRPHAQLASSRAGPEARRSSRQIAIDSGPS